MAAKTKSSDEAPSAETKALQEQAAALTAELERMKTLVEQLEEWGRASEDWARSAEALLHMPSQGGASARHDRNLYDEVEALRASTSWRITAPLRAVSSAARRTVRSGIPAAKSGARPVLDAGLVAVRKHAGLRRAVRSVLRRVPAAEARLQSFADTRPATKDSE